MQLHNFMQWEAVLLSSNSWTQLRAVEWAIEVTVDQGLPVTWYDCYSTHSPSLLPMNKWLSLLSITFKRVVVLWAEPLQNCMSAYEFDVTGKCIWCRYLGKQPECLFTYSIVKLSNVHLKQITVVHMLHRWHCKHWRNQPTFSRKKRKPSRLAYSIEFPCCNATNLRSVSKCTDSAMSFIALPLLQYVMCHTSRLR